jgi:hypothetical protein
MPDYPVSFLGAFESTVRDVTAAYTVFPNGGVYRPPFFIWRVENEKGEVIFKPELKPKQILRPESAWMVSSCLQEVMTTGTAAKAKQLGWKNPSAGKTGTTNDFHDAWFVGYTSSLTCGVWVGMDKPETIKEKGYGSALALPIWIAAMQQAPVQRYPAGPLQAPVQLTRVNLCSATGAVATPGCELARTAYQANIPVTKVPSRKCAAHPDAVPMPAAPLTPFYTGNDPGRPTIALGGTLPGRVAAPPQVAAAPVAPAPQATVASSGSPAPAATVAPAVTAQSVGPAAAPAPASIAVAPPVRAAAPRSSTVAPSASVAVAPNVAPAIAPAAPAANDPRAAMPPAPARIAESPRAPVAMAPPRGPDVAPPARRSVAVVPAEPAPYVPPPERARTRVLRPAERYLEHDVAAVPAPAPRESSRVQRSPRTVQVQREMPDGTRYLTEEIPVRRAQPVTRDESPDARRRAMLEDVRREIAQEEALRTREKPRLFRRGGIQIFDDND